jgi:hypothetical protein
MRKASAQEVQAKQDEMAQAAQRRINRRLFLAKQHRHADEHSQYISYLEGCREDVVRVPFREGREQTGRAA